MCCVAAFIVSVDLTATTAPFHDVCVDFTTHYLTLLISFYLYTITDLGSTYEPQGMVCEVT